MPYDVQLTQASTRHLAVVQRRAKQAELPTVIPPACGIVWQFLRANKILHTGHNIVVYHDLEMNIDCGVEIVKPFSSEPPVLYTATPAGLVATTVHKGPYHKLGEAHDAIQQWCKANGHKFAFPCWEYYGHWFEDEDELRTDVFYLIKPAP